jgi:chromosome segregation ATPase
MELTLKSYPVFVDYENRMNEKKRILNERVSANQTALNALKKEYAELFASDADTSIIAKQLQKLNEEAAGLQVELEVIEAADLKQYELASAVQDEYEQLKRQVTIERQRVYEQAEKVVERAKEEVENLEKHYQDLADRFNFEVANNQFRNIIDNLNISDGNKQSLYLQVENALTAYSVFPKYFNTLPKYE